MPHDASPFAARLGLLLVAALVFIIFGVAGADFFRRPAYSQRLRFRLHQVGSLFVGSVHVGAAALAPLAGAKAVSVAIALYCFGLALFLWTQETVKHAPPYLAFSGVPPEQLFVSGPYRFIRHPFYLAFTLALFAVPVATWNPWLLASAFVMTVNYVAAAFEEEAAYVRTPYAERHRAYAFRTGMFAPWPHTLTPAVFDRPQSPIVIGAIVLAIGLTLMMLWELLLP